MRLDRLELRDFRNYEHAELGLAPGLTVVAGPNAAGKTNLLEALYFGCTGRSPRTANERELVRRGADVTRVVVEGTAEDGLHRLEVGLEPGQAKRQRVDGHPVESLVNAAERPLVSVFLPERLELVKGPPSGRRAHLDRLVAALWPARGDTRLAYGRALGQRNALLARVRSGVASAAGLDAWDAELAGHGARLIADRREAVEALAPLFAGHGERLGLAGGPGLGYRPRSRAKEAAELAAELAERRQADLDRGFTAHGPHRDELALQLDGASLRAYGSQGQQRVAVLALLFAERELLAAQRARPPLMLLDDVMSELDASRRELLGELLRDGGQAVVTATEAEHVPGCGENGVAVARVEAGSVRNAPAGPRRVAA
ncbi:MAG: DNA replication/repair protein RecF [Thermoleophilaceae bacterium]